MAADSSRHRFEAEIAGVLRAGVIVSAIAVCLGGACYLYRHGSEPATHSVFRGEPASYRSISGIIGAVGAGNCRGVIQLGLLLLIATPITRVALSLVAFTRERDYAYTIITLIVLAVLLYSLIAEH